MATRKFCVMNCSSNSDSHRLFRLPRDDKLRDLWLSFLIPSTPLLSGLNKEQLLNKQVCQKHFDRHQFDQKGDRLQHGYPCLFTEKEMLHRIPMNSSVADHLTDHNYNNPVSEEDNETPSMIVVEDGQQQMNDHSYALRILSDNSIEASGNTANEGQTSSTPAYILSAELKKATSINTVKGPVAQKLMLPINF